VAVTSPASGATHELDPRKRRVVRSGGRILRRAALRRLLPGPHAERPVRAGGSDGAPGLG